MADEALSITLLSSNDTVSYTSKSCFVSWYIIASSKMYQYHIPFVLCHLKIYGCCFQTQSPSFFVVEALTLATPLYFIIFESFCVKALTILIFV